MLKAVFFDLDDTLLDFRKAEAQALTGTLRRFGLDPSPENLERYHEINRQHWKMLEEGRITRAQVMVERFRLFLGELGADCPCEAVCEDYEENLGRGHFFVPGAEAVLERLAPRYALYLATNGTARVQRSRLESAGILPFFRRLFISQELGADKPSPAFFRACFAAIPGLGPAETVMVGDSLTSDIRGARDAGLRTCWFNPEGRPAPAELRPDLEVRALEELPEALARL